MPPDTEDAGSAAEWLIRARSNLALARQAKPPEVYWDDLCFESQQAVEKALKAVLVGRGIRFRCVHDTLSSASILAKRARIVRW